MKEELRKMVEQIRYRLLCLGYEDANGNLSEDEKYLERVYESWLEMYKEADNARLRELVKNWTKCTCGPSSMVPCVQCNILQETQP